MTIDATVAKANAAEAARPTYVFLFPSSADALLAAINQFDSQAAFYRALTERAKKTITKAAVSQWKRRGHGAPSDFAPDIEAISGVPCEELCRDVSWEVLRRDTPPLHRGPRPEPGSRIVGECSRQSPEGVD